MTNEITLFINYALSLNFVEITPLFFNMLHILNKSIDKTQDSRIM